MPEVRLAASAMRTRFECVLQGADAVALRAAGEEALEEIHATERELSCFRKDAFLARLNRDAATRAVPVPRRLMDVLLACRALHEETGGAFDPAVAPLMRRHGFRADLPGGTAGAPLSALLLDEAAGTVRYADPALELDLGAIGKGVALDRAAECLADADVRHALLHGGTSTLRALGPQADGRPWPVAVADPEDAERTVWSGTLADAALSVSANAGRTAPAGHVMDPHRGAPAASPTRAAIMRVDCAAHPRDAATRADAWSTAWLVRGRAEIEHRVLGADPAPTP